MQRTGQGRSPCVAHHRLNIAVTRVVPEWAVCIGILVIHAVWKRLIDCVVVEVAGLAEHDAELLVKDIRRPEYPPLALQLGVVGTQENIAAETAVSAYLAMQAEGGEHLQGISEGVPDLRKATCENEVRVLEETGLGGLERWRAILGVGEGDGRREHVVAKVERPDPLIWLVALLVTMRPVAPEGAHGQAHGQAH